MMRSFLWLCCALAVACQRPAYIQLSLPRDAAQSPIIGGHSVPTGATLQVFMMAELLTYEYQGKQALGLAVCSATLVGSKTLLTAAHCLDMRVDVQQLDTNDPNSAVAPVAMDIWALNGSDLSSVLDSATLALQNSASTDPLGDTQRVFKNAGGYEVVKSLFPSTWDPLNVGGGSDVGMALLDRGPGIVPKPFNTTAVALQGKTIRIVGYGIDNASASTGAGQLREIDLAAGAVSKGIITTGDGTSQGICHGDSGGPSLFTFPDNVERVVGVHSYTANTACLRGGDSEVDTYASFIQQFLDANDSACVRDGVCNAACTGATPDPDCAALGGACTNDQDCASGLCIADAQHPATYCSMSCNTTADCSNDLVCLTSQCQKKQLPWARLGENCAAEVAVCKTGFDCVNMSNGTQICWEQCTQDSDCVTAQSCNQTIDEGTYCSQKVLAAKTASDAATKTGCNATAEPVWLVILAAGFVLRARRRRD